MDGIDPKFSNALCPDDLERVTDVLEGAFARMPALTEVGIHTIVNGPITYTIDGAPLVGPIPGRRNAFASLACVPVWARAGAWLASCQQIVHGEACYDTCPLDPRRFTGHGNVELTALKAIEDYQNEFRFHFRTSTDRRSPDKDNASDTRSCRRRGRLFRGQWLGAARLHQALRGLHRNPQFPI